MPLDAALQLYGAELGEDWIKEKYKKEEAVIFGITPPATLELPEWTMPPK